MKHSRQKSVICFYIAIFFLISLCQFPNVALSETNISAIKTVAITPFQINSPKDISYIQNGIREMLSSRLAWKDKTLVVSENLESIKDGLIKKDITETEYISSKNNISKEKEGRQNLASFDYIIRGSITEFAGAFSVDATVYNIRQNSSQSFFIQAETLEKIIPSVEILSAKINKDIFNRETASLALLEEEKKEGTTNSSRANPEKLMPLTSFEQGEIEKKRPFWKFWGKDSPDGRESNSLEANSLKANVISQNSSLGNSDSTKNVPSEEKIELNSQINSDDEEEEEMEDVKKPFWKFW
ncbi:MAG: hypothetical protein HQK63_13770 [Desulfamplus sp.]|nr:hypothetical protein [Desulfamplus sp.]